MTLSLDNIGLVHPNGQRALQRVSLALRSGERVAVILFRMIVLSRFTRRRPAGAWRAAGPGRARDCARAAA